MWGVVWCGVGHEELIQRQVYKEDLAYILPSLKLFSFMGMLNPPVCHWQRAVNNWHSVYVQTLSLIHIDRCIKKEAQML